MTVVTGFSTGCWGPPTGGSRRLPTSWSTGWAHCLGVLSAAGYCCLAPDDEVFVEVSVATVRRLAGPHCSLTSSCLLNVAHASRKGVAGFWGPAPPLADWGRAGPPSHLSLAKGARRPWAVLAFVVDDVEANMATMPSRTGDG